jgi:protein O-mannosyl-transferase
MKHFSKMRPQQFLLCGIIITLVTFASFYPSLQCEWTLWDDNVYVTDNLVVQNISIANLKQIFTSYNGSFLPLTMFSYMLNYAFAEYSPFAYHATNLFIHIINSLLVCWLAYLLSRNLFIGLFAGVFFGIHPMHVESVAWISGRKDVLSAMFFFLSLISYIKYVGNENFKYLFVSMCLFVASLLSKVIVITFPLILLLIDIYLNRKYTVSLLKEKIIYCIAAIVFALIGFYAQVFNHAVRHHKPFFEVVSGICYQILFYLEKLFIPFSLSSFYPYPHTANGGLPLEYYISVFVLIIMSLLMWRYGRKNNVFIFGFLFFLISIMPVLQIVRFSNIITADRFTYISYFGLLYFVGFSISKKIESCSKIQTRIIITALCIVTVTFSIITYERCKVWKDGNTLWEDVFKKYPNALNN